MGNLGAVSSISGREAQHLFPALGDVPGAIHVPDAARVNGRLLRGALQRAVQKRGATVVTASATPVRQGDRVTGVEAAGQTLAADAVLLAGGAWSNELGAALGINLPIYPQRGQILHLDMPDTDTSRWPIVVGFHSHYILTFPASRVVCGATREDAPGYDVRVTVAGVHEVTGEALRVAPGLGRGTLHEVRVGLRPASPDGRPVLGRLPGLENVYVATGHGPEGLTLGPYSGAAVADLLQGRSVGVDLTPYTPDRFQLSPAR
jgi:D-amino-acid dehydrogenase